MKKKLLYIGALLVWLLCLIQVIYWWLEEPVIYYNQNITIDKPVYRNSKSLLLHSRFCQSRDALPGTATRMIKNAAVYHLTDTALIPQAGCYDVRRELDLPGGLVIGPHTYEFEATFQINPIKTVRARIQPVPFTVLP